MRGREASPVPHDPRLLHAILRSDFTSFVRKVFATLNPGNAYLHNWHVQAIVHELMEMVEGRNHRLIINLPPRHLKSVIASVALPAWLLGHDPTCRIVCVSYSGDLAAKFTRDFRRVITSPWYREIFPGTIIAKNTEMEVETTRTGSRYATSVQGTLTGRGGDWIIIDDPMKQDEAESEARRTDVREWFTGTALNRLDNRATGRILVVMQRVHLQDLSGMLLDIGTWRHLKLPAIAEEEAVIPLGWGRFHQRTHGSLLHPQREPLERLEELKKAMGSRAFAAQYQQEPVPGDGQIIRTAWFKRYVRPELPEPSHNVLTVISVDTAQKGLLTSDYSVAMVIRYDRKTRLSYIIDIIRGQLDYPDLRRKIFDLHYRHRPHHWVIEDRGSGTSLIQELNRDYIRPIAINPKGDKLSRVQAITPYLERGEVLLPENTPWIDDFLAETATYPQGRYDDQVDALAQYLNWVEDGTRPKAGILQMTGGHRS